MSELHTYNPDPKTPYAVRDPHDFYPTPIALCRAAIKLLPIHFQPLILDPGAGTGVWGQAAKEYWPLSWIRGVELRNDAAWPEAYTEWYYGDFLQWTSNSVVLNNIVLGNPPYKLAEAFVRKSLELTIHHGYVMFLLRLAFLEGQARGTGLWKEFPPCQVHVCSRRPSFMPEGSAKAGKTDATDYGIYLWQKGYSGPTELRWLNW